MPDFFAVNKCARIRSVAANQQGPVRMFELYRSNPLWVRIDILGNRRQVSKARADFQRTRRQIHGEWGFAEFGLTEKNAGSSGITAKRDISTPERVIDLSRVIGCEFYGF